MTIEFQWQRESLLTPTNTTALSVQGLLSLNKGWNDGGQSQQRRELEHFRFRTGVGTPEASRKSSTAL